VWRGASPRAGRNRLEHRRPTPVWSIPARWEEPRWGGRLKSSEAEHPRALGGTDSDEDDDEGASPRAGRNRKRGDGFERVARSIPARGEEPD